MALTEQFKRTAHGVKEKGMTLISHLGDADTRATLQQNGRTVVSQASALVTDKVGSARDAVQEHGPKVYKQTKEIGAKGVDLVREHAPKAMIPARAACRKASKIGHDKAPAVNGFVSRNCDEIMLTLAVIDAIFLAWRIRTRRGNKK